MNLFTFFNCLAFVFARLLFDILFAMVRVKWVLCNTWHFPFDFMLKLLFSSWMFVCWNELAVSVIQKALHNYVLDENCNTNSLNSFAISMSHACTLFRWLLRWNERIPQMYFLCGSRCHCAFVPRHISNVHAHVRHICGEYCLMHENNGINLANNIIIIIIIKPTYTERNSYVLRF